MTQITCSLSVTYYLVAARFCAASSAISIAVFVHYPHPCAARSSAVLSALGLQYRVLFRVSVFGHQQCIFVPR